MDAARLNAERRVPDSVIDRIDRLKAELGDRPTDDFGFDPESIKPIAPALHWLYRHYFRVEASGLQGVPTGRVLFISNHSGQIPLDGMMIGCALLFEGAPPRAVRSMVERWVPTLPFVSTVFARLGQVLGTPENCRTLL
jgi:1-acyl-sn-glycerol-3-phosphate acyltransferase